MPRKSKPRVSCVRIGTLCRAINALEGMNEPYDADQNVVDVNEIRDILLETAMHLVACGARLSDINAQLEDAGWDDCRLEAEKDEKLSDTLRWDFD
jgi:hypothetical protein